MKITKEEIESKKTERGGYTRKQLAVWGVPWPPPKGWKAKLLTGETAITEEETEEVIKALIELVDLLASRIDMLEDKVEQLMPTIS